MTSVPDRVSAAGVWRVLGAAGGCCSFLVVGVGPGGWFELVVPLAGGREPMGLLVVGDYVRPGLARDSELCANPVLLMTRDCP